MRAHSVGLCLFVAMMLTMATIAPSAAYQRPGSTALVSVASDGNQANNKDPRTVGEDAGPSISGDGRYVAFVSRSDNLVPGDTNEIADVFVRDTKLGATTRVSVSSTGAQALWPPILPYAKLHPSISADGRYVAFVSVAPNLVIGDANGAPDIFVHDRETKTTDRVSVTSKGEEILPIDPHDLNANDKPMISSNGRYVTFVSSSLDLLDGSAPEPGLDDPLGRVDRSQVYVHDRATGDTRLASVTSEGEPGNSKSSCPSVSRDGKVVAFLSKASNLYGDPSATALSSGASYGHAFIHNFTNNQTRMVSVSSDGEPAQPSASKLQVVVDSFCSGGRTISDDGRFVVFSTNASNMVPNDGPADGAGGVFVYDLKTERIRQASVSSSGGDVPWHHGTISQDGRFVAFSGGDGTDPRASALCGSTQTQNSMVFLYDIRWESLECVSRNSAGEPPRSGRQSGDGSESLFPALGKSGRYIAFLSDAVNLVTGDRNGYQDTFLRDNGSPLGVGNISRRLDVRFEGSKDPSSGRALVNDGIRDTGSPMTRMGANLYGASLAYRPQYDDLFAAIELEHMPQVVPGLSPIFYGLRFKVDDKSYEVRATSLGYGTFGLFDCSDPMPTCTKVADLRGGYGTTGTRVVFSLPLEAIGLEDGGELSDVEAFSALGSSYNGTVQLLDRLHLR